MSYDFATDTHAQIAQAYQLAYFPTTYFIDNKDRVFKTEISTLNADVVLEILREMGLR